MQLELFFAADFGILLYPRLAMWNALETELMLRQDMVFVDLETTGLDPGRDRVIEVGIIRISDGEIIESFNSLVNPQCEIPPTVKKITGIKKHDLLKAPVFNEVIGEVQRMTRNAIFVAHNADFDYTFLENEFSRLERTFALPRLCTVKLSRELYPDFISHNLDSISRRFEIAIDNRHRAMDDALATWQFMKITEKRLGINLLKQAVVKLMQEAKPKRVKSNTIAQLSLI